MKIEIIINSFIILLILLTIYIIFTIKNKVEYFRTDSEKTPDIDIDIKNDVNVDIDINLEPKSENREMSNENDRGLGEYKRSGNQPRQKQNSHQTPQTPQGQLGNSNPPGRVNVEDNS